MIGSIFFVGSSGMTAVGVACLKDAYLLIYYWGFDGNGTSTENDQGLGPR